MQGERRRREKGEEEKENCTWKDKKEEREYNWLKN